MTYTNINNTAIITGSKGPYRDDKAHINYSKNAMNNYTGYSLSIDKNLQGRDTFGFAKYKKPFGEKVSGFFKKIGDGFVGIKDSIALAFASDKNLKKAEIETKNLAKEKLTPIDFELKYTQNLPKTQNGKMGLMAAAYVELGGQSSIALDKYNKLFASTPELSGDALDLNDDKQIDISEEAASILAADALSKGEEIDIEKIDGTMTNKGANALIGLAVIENKETASAEFKKLHETFELNKAQEDFLKSQNT